MLKKMSLPRNAAPMELMSRKDTLRIKNKNDRKFYPGSVINLQKWLKMTKTAFSSNFDHIRSVSLETYETYTAEIVVYFKWLIDKI